MQHRSDLIIGIVLSLFGAVVVRESLVMPRYASIGADPVTAPGLVPGLLGGIIGLLGLIMVVRAALGLRAAATPVAAPSGPTDDEDRGAPAYVAESPHAGRNRLATVLATGLIFAGLAVGRLPFWLATFLFVLVTVILLELQRYGAGKGLWQRLVVAAVIAGGTAWGVTYVFESIFLVRLP